MLETKIQLNELSHKIHEIAKQKGFYDSGTINIPGCLMLIVSELSEAMEADRKGKYSNMASMRISTQLGTDEHSEYTFKERFEFYIKDTFEDELADTIIRILDLCGYLNIDIEKHIELKMKYNQTRERMHGKKY